MKGRRQSQARRDDLYLKALSQDESFIRLILEPLGRLRKNNEVVLKTSEEITQMLRAQGAVGVVDTILGILKRATEKINNG